MRLVRDYKLLTNTKAKAKADSLRSNQQRFLANMETCITWEISTLDLPDTTLGANLRHIIMNIPDPEKPEEKLFHAVNKMLRHDGYIFRFNPSRSQSAREVVAGLLVFLQGTWASTLAPDKFHKFFTGPAIERAADAWWDSQERCVVTKADAEMDELMQQDVDLTFPEDEVTIDLTEVEATQQVDTGTTTDSISTFQTAATPKAKSGVKAANKRETFDQASAMTGTTISESDFNILLSQLTQALQLNLKSPPGGSETGKST